MSVCHALQPFYAILDNERALYHVESTLQGFNRGGYTYGKICSGWRCFQVLVGYFENNLIHRFFGLICTMIAGLETLVMSDKKE